MNRSATNISRRAFIAAQALLLCGSLASCAQNDFEAVEQSVSSPRTLDEIRASGFVRIGIYSDYPPLGHINSNGNFSGFEQYFGLYAAAELGVDPHFLPVDPLARYDVLTGGEVDVCLAGISLLDSNGSKVALADPLYGVNLALCSSVKAQPTSFDSLENGELIVCKGSYAEQFAQNLSSGVHLVPYSTQSDSLNALEYRNEPILLADEVCLTYWLADKEGYVVTPLDHSGYRTVSPAVADPGSELFHIIQSSVNGFFTSGNAEYAFNTFVKPNVGDAYRAAFLEPTNQ